MARKPKAPKQVETLTHDEARRKNIPTAELQSAAQRAEEIHPVKPVTYKRQNPLAEGETRPRDEDLDPQIVWNGSTLRLSSAQIEQLTQTGKLEIGDAQLTWRGKDQQDWSDLIVQAPPLYIQEKIHPKAIIDNLKRQTKERQEEQADTADLFGDFNGLPDMEARTEFYQHDQHWSNRMILGDSLQVMASLAEREGLRGQVQCIYFDPPYGIKFKSNWQTSTRDPKMPSTDRMSSATREPEQVKAFRDTWADGIHSYLTYLRDRLTAMRDLLHTSGSIFFQISEENVHRIRAVCDEVFGEENFVAQIAFRKKLMPLGGKTLEGMADYLVWYSKDKKQVKYRQLYVPTKPNPKGRWTGVRVQNGPLRRLNELERRSFKNIKNEDAIFGTVSQWAPSYSDQGIFSFEFEGNTYKPTSGKSWVTTDEKMKRLARANRFFVEGKFPRFVSFHEDFKFKKLTHPWSDTAPAQDKNYVVETNEKVVQRCILMTTDPGDLVLDPTCGSGTTAYVAEQWARRWITLDTSRVALALARTRVMGAKFPYFYLSDSDDGRNKEQDLSGKVQPDTQTNNDIRQGFVYERAPHVRLKSIAANAAIDVIWDNYQPKMSDTLSDINSILGAKYNEWDIPLEADNLWSDDVKKRHREWWKLRTDRQSEIDKSIVQQSEVETLYDRPYEDRSKVRVAGPFTVESLSPHRVVPADEEELTELLDAEDGNRERKDAPLQDFAQMVMENLKSAGVHQAARDDRITFNSLEGWPGTFIAAQGTYSEGENEKRAAIFIGPEFGSVTRADLTAAAREALDSRYDVLIACGFNFDAHSSELNKLGPLPILKAKMNPDLHMSDELKNTGAGNLFVVFGEPDIEWDFDRDGNIIVEVLGVDVFDPKTGEVRASGKDDIAAWFIDTDYDETSFFVRHAYFLGANDPYKSLKTALKAEIDKEAWQTLYRDKSRPFGRPSTGRFAVKVINHFGDEVMKVFGV